MTGIQRCAGINITASRLQFVEVEKESDQLVVSNIGQTFISPPINFEDPVEANISNQLQTAFDEIKIRNPVNSTISSFTLPPELFITIQLPYDANLNQKEIREEFNWEVSQLFPFRPIDDLAIKFYELEKGLLPGKHNALVVALNKKYLLLIKYFCLKNNLTPRLVDNASITANSFLNTSAIAEKALVTVNIFNSRHSLTLFINISSKPVYVKVFQKQDDGVITRIIEVLSQENFRNVLSTPLKKAVLSGEDIGADSLSELHKATGLEFKKFQPFDLLRFKTGLQIHEISEEHYNTFTSAAGIASRFI
ncbi:MAG: pilus assembly protein PilM [Ignavibacteriaceae bacterium]|nr:pilus assembly protein PilM [Ignavibacteriaceae bacterium]